VKLEHSFGDDGLFWMSYEDFMQKFQVLDRTELLADDWTNSQKWASLNIPWKSEDLKTRFSFTLARPSSVVIVLSQVCLEKLLYINRD